MPSEKSKKANIHFQVSGQLSDLAACQILTNLLTRERKQVSADILTTG